MIKDESTKIPFIETIWISSTITLELHNQDQGVVGQGVLIGMRLVKKDIFFVVPVDSPI